MFSFLVLVFFTPSPTLTMDTPLLLTVLDNLTQPATECRQLAYEYAENQRQRREQEQKESAELQEKKSLLSAQQDYAAFQLSTQLDRLFDTAWKQAVAQDDPLTGCYYEIAKYLKQQGIPIVPLTAVEVRQRYGEWLMLQDASVLTLSERLPDKEPVKFCNQVITDNELTYFDVSTGSGTKTYFFCDLADGYHRSILGSQRVVHTILDKNYRGDVPYMLERITKHNDFSHNSLLLGTSYVLAQEVTRLQ